MTQHTPGPWGKSKHTSDVVANGKIIARHFTDGTYGPVLDKEIQEANMRRIIACVNACEGIITETLENEQREHLEAQDSRPGFLAAAFEDLDANILRAGQAYAARDDRAKRLTEVMEQLQAAIRERNELRDAIKATMDAKSEAEDEAAFRKLLAAYNKATGQN